MATVRHLGLFPRPNSIDPLCLDVIPTGEEDPDRTKTWHRVTPQQATKIYWRVKRWQATIDAEYSVPVFEDLPDPDDPDFSFPQFVGFEVIPITSVQQFDPASPPFLEAEGDLVCMPNATPYWFGPVAEEVQLLVYFEGNIGGQNGPLNIRKDPDPDNADVYVGFTALLGFSEFTRLNIELSEELVFTFSWDQARNDEYSSPYSGTVEVKPQEYWPYDPEDGLGPIYDSATGAQLRPFPQ
jgi:hypothetical protein